MVEESAKSGEMILEKLDNSKTSRFYWLLTIL